MTQTLTTYDQYEADFQALGQAAEPQWLRELRNAAWERFRDVGFPTARRGNEKWKYTNVAPIANGTFSYSADQVPPAISPEQVKASAPWRDEWTNLVFVNGRFTPSLSSPMSGDGLKAMNLADAVRGSGKEAALAREHLARYASPDDDAFTALNTAFAQDGAFIYTAPNARPENPVHVVHITDAGQPIVSHPRTLAVAGTNSSLSLLESYVSRSAGKHFTNSVTEVVLQDGAHIAHSRTVMEGQAPFHVGSTHVDMTRDSNFESRCFSRGSALNRQNLTVLLDGPGTYCDLKGLYLTNDGEHVDHYVNIDHAKPHTTSRLYYKGILDGRSRAVFGGTVLVREDAQKSDAQQSDKNLLLSPEAEVDSKPALLIYADDVSCAHGATAGNIDKDTVHYMRSRGLDLDEASRLLIHGFAREIIDTATVEPVREFLDFTFMRALANSRLEAV